MSEVGIIRVTRIGEVHVNETIMHLYSCGLSALLARYFSGVRADSFVMEKGTNRITVLIYY